MQNDSPASRRADPNEREIAITRRLFLEGQHCHVRRKFLKVYKNQDPRNQRLHCSPAVAIDQAQHRHCSPSACAKTVFRAATSTGAITTMTDLITSTFAALCCFCFPCSQEKRRDKNEDESDAEALEKAAKWRERMANAERGGKPPGYQAPMEMNTGGGRQSVVGGHVRGSSRGDVVGDGQGVRS